eukprot:scaffold4027_cov32-Phaeocystis_antarctica.AAC.2
MASLDCPLSEFQRVVPCVHLSFTLPQRCPKLLVTLLRLRPLLLRPRPLLLRPRPLLFTLLV